MKWLINHWEDVLIALGEHVTIALTALVIATAVSLPIGIWAAKNDRVYRVALAVSGFLYTIPTLAFLALLIPVVGLGKTNAIICMVAFSLMILIRNVATGIREVAPGREGARTRECHSGIRAFPSTPAHRGCAGRPQGPRCGATRGDDLDIVRRPRCHVRPPSAVEGNRFAD